LPDQERAIIKAAETTAHRLLLECLWQSGGCISEVLRLRPSDLDEVESALHMQNLKQRRRANKTKLVYGSADLIGDLRRYTRDARIRQTSYLFRARHHDRPHLEAIRWPPDQPVRPGRGHVP
jgi:integrase